MLKWLNVAFAARALLSDTTCLTLTARQTEPGSPTSARLRQLLTVPISPFTFALVAFVQERSSALNCAEKLRRVGGAFSYILFNSRYAMKIALTDIRISHKCERALKIRGFHVIKMPPMPTLPAPMASHPDMLLTYIDGTILTSAEYCDSAAYLFCEIRELLPHIQIRFCDTAQGSEYPFDAAYNALSVGKKLFCRTKTVAPQILEFAKEHSFEIINVNQGYPACTTLALGESHAISADDGMCRALFENGISVSRIENGGILLPPYEYGFIGGACGVYKDSAYFLGNLDLHPSANIIKNTCRMANITPISLSDEPLSDLGRIIFLD